MIRDELHMFLIRVAADHTSQAGRAEHGLIRADGGQAAVLRCTAVQHRLLLPHGGYALALNRPGQNIQCCRLANYLDWSTYPPHLACLTSVPRYVYIWMGMTRELSVGVV